MPRAHYRAFQAITTRWADNDVYGHVNNVVYYSWFDTAVNSHLIAQGALDIHHGSTIGLVVETQCNYFAPLAFPQVVEAGIRVARLGGSSVCYEVGVFAQPLRIVPLQPRCPVDVVLAFPPPSAPSAMAERFTALLQAHFQALSGAGRRSNGVIR